MGRQVSFRPNVVEGVLLVELYIWTDRTKAQAALDYINNHECLPHVGTNAATGEPAPEKQNTIRWSDLVELTDGRFGFKRISEAWLDTLGIDEAGRQAYLGTFNPTIELLDLDLMPEPEVM